MYNANEKITEILPNTYLIKLNRSNDERGSFVKTFNRSSLGGISPEVGNFDFQEEFYSISNENVLRGMHFQLPPHQHDKIVYCASGVVCDVLLDLRSGENYGKYFTFCLNSEIPEILFIPEGVAHGFMSLSNNSLMVYKTSSEYSPEHDFGIHYNTFGYTWINQEPIVSTRDQKHIDFSKFKSPF
jgi:dTDP-4-dehydrorhamnose 3,5-epimerase